MAEPLLQQIDQLLGTERVGAVVLVLALDILCCFVRLPRSRNPLELAIALCNRQVRRSTATRPINALTAATGLVQGGHHGLGELVALAERVEFRDPK